MRKKAGNNEKKLLMRALDGLPGAVDFDPHNTIRNRIRFDNVEGAYGYEVNKQMRVMFIRQSNGRIRVCMFGNKEEIRKALKNL